jgi:hypothetical protein
MEQTFATTELMNASYQFMKKTQLQKMKNNKTSRNIDVEMKQEKNFLNIYYKNILICTVDAAQCKITYLKNTLLGPNGITVSFNGPYQILNKVKQKIKRYLRGSIGKYLLGIKDVSYVIKGVRSPKETQMSGIDWFSKHIHSYSIDWSSKQNAIIKATSSNHQVLFNIQVSVRKNVPTIIIDPVEIYILGHDLDCTRCFVPVIDAPGKIIDKNTLQIQDCLIKGDFPSIQVDTKSTVIDQTLATNWTHGGVFSTWLEITLNI